MQQKASATTASTTAAEDDAAASCVAVPPQEEKKEKNKKSEYRDGKHPDTGLLIRNCSCPNNTKCRERAWSYAAMGNEEMVHYVYVPPYPAKTKTAAGRHTIKFRNCLARHLLGAKHSDGLPNQWNSQNRISIQHFPSEFRDVLRNMASEKVNKWRISLDVGKAHMLTEIDLCEDKKHYFAAPTLREEAIDEELKEAQRVHAIKTGHGVTAAAHIQTGTFGHVTTSMLKTPKQKTASTKQSSNDGDRSITAVPATPVNRTRSRLSTEAKEHEILMKEMEKDPHKFVQKFIDMKKDLGKLKILADDLMQQKKKDKDEYEKKVKQLTEDFECMVTANGLNRKSLLSNELVKVLLDVNIPVWNGLGTAQKLC